MWFHSTKCIGHQICAATSPQKKSTGNSELYALQKSFFFSLLIYVVNALHNTTNVYSIAGAHHDFNFTHDKNPLKYCPSGERTWTCCSSFEHLFIPFWFKTKETVERNSKQLCERNFLEEIMQYTILFHSLGCVVFTEIAEVHMEYSKILVTQGILSLILASCALFLVQH